MSVNELERKISKMQEWESLAEEAKAEAEALRDEIKAEMLERDTEELEAGKYIVRWTSVRISAGAPRKRRSTDRLFSAVYRVSTPETFRFRFLSSGPKAAAIFRSHDRYGAVRLHGDLHPRLHIVQKLIAQLVYDGHFRICPYTAEDGSGGCKRINGH